MAGFGWPPRKMSLLDHRPPCYWFWKKKKDSTHETATGNMRRMLRPIAATLNGSNVRTGRGQLWYGSTVRTLNRALVCSSA